MNIRIFAGRTIAGMTCCAMLVFSGLASADPPSRVARLGYLTGPVSFSPAGEDDWVQAAVNRPLSTGDRLWSDAGGRAEIQIGGAMIRLGADTGLSVLNFDDEIVQLQLTEGTLNVRVRRLERNQVFEVDTPNLAFTLRQAGEFRIEVDPDGNATTIHMRKGQGQVYGEGAEYFIDPQQSYRFAGSELDDFEYMNAPRRDEFDRWAGDRDRRFDRSGSARYVSQDVVGYQDLDANGTWRSDATWGNVWYPNRVSADWAPYRDGHWAWVDPWGWTWMDDAPWGFAVSHYGRWTHTGSAWGWVPGPARSRAYYAPALVAFVGGDNFQLTVSSGNVGGVAWFPLGPRDVYRPSYTVSRGYFENVNRSNTVINNTVINNYYNNSNVTNIVYANRQVPGAVVAVPRTVFLQSQPVSRVAVRASNEQLANAPVAMVPRLVPTERSVRGAAAKADKPPKRVFERPVVARSAPPASHAGFMAQQKELTAQPGKPLDAAARRELKPAASTAPVAAPVVKVIAPPADAARAVRKLPAAPPGLQGNTGAKALGRRPDAAEEKPAAAAAEKPAATAEPRAPGQARKQPAEPPVSAAPLPATGAKGAASPAPADEPRGKGRQRSQPESPATVPAAPADEPRGKGRQRSQPESPATVPVVSPVPPPVPPAQAAPRAAPVEKSAPVPPAKAPKVNESPAPLPASPLPGRRAPKTDAPELEVKPAKADKAKDQVKGKDRENDKEMDKDKSKGKEKDKDKKDRDDEGRKGKN